ncbi:MAG: ATP-binding cassette domain-containing protein [Geminicoccaceae bacterium]
MPDPDCLLRVARHPSALPPAAPASSGRHRGIALDGVTLRLHTGETLGIVGRSGSGKSTSAATPSASSGGQRHGRFQGVDLWGADPRAGGRRGQRRVRQSAQMVFQDPYGSLDPRQKIARIVAEPLGLLRLGSTEAADHCVAALARWSSVGGPRPLPARVLRRPAPASIAIARALITRPALLVADEPVSASTSRSRPRCSTSWPSCGSAMA